MKIHTKELCLTKREYFKLSVINFLRKDWWIIISLIFITVHATYKGYKFAIFLAIFTIFYTFYHPLDYLIYINSKGNKILFKNRSYEIDDDFITILFNDGSLTKVNLDNVIRVFRSASYYLLYISKIQFIYVPSNIFYTVEDKNKFDIMLRNKKHLTTRCT